MQIQFAANVSTCTRSRLLQFVVALNSTFCKPITSRKVSTRGISMETANGAYDNKQVALIVLEGLDRSDKSSQCSQMAFYLGSQGFSIEAWRFLDRNTAVGKMISTYLSSKADLDDRTIHLLFSANRWEKRSLMEAKLKAGTTLIVDRYSYSGVAFSAVKGLGHISRESSRTWWLWRRAI